MCTCGAEVQRGHQTSEVLAMWVLRDDPATAPRRQVRRRQDFPIDFASGLVAEVEGTLSQCNYILLVIRGPSNTKEDDAERQATKVVNLELSTWHITFNPYGWKLTCNRARYYLHSTATSLKPALRATRQTIHLAHRPLATPTTEPTYR